MRRRAPHAVLIAALAVLACGAAALPPGRVAQRPARALIAVALAKGPPTGGSAPSGATRAVAVVHPTFDDGPDPTWTPQVLDVMSRYGARGTFFMVGQSVAQERRLVQRVRDEGHAVANHTWSHPQLVALSDAGIRRQLDRTDGVLGATSCVRQPYGATNARVERVVRATGHHPVLWDVDPQDWRRPGARAIAERILAGTRPGAVILLHDGGGDRAQTVAGLERALAVMTSKGYAVTPVPGCSK